MPGNNLDSFSALVVEPQESMRGVLRSALRRLGIPQIVMATDVREALDHFRNTRFDLVFSDWSSQVDGISLLCWIRNAPASTNRYVPIMIATHNTALTDFSLARDAGLNEFVVKPISLGGIVERVRRTMAMTYHFVQSEDYFGPDRRQRSQPFTGRNRRGRPADIVPEVFPHFTESEDGVHHADRWFV